MKPWAVIGGMVLGAALALGGCVTYQHDDGSSETDLLGFIPVYSSTADGSTWLSPLVQQVAPSWLKIALLGIGSWKTLETVGTKRGRKNISVITDPETPGRAKLKAARAIGLGTASPVPVVAAELPEVPQARVTGFTNGDH